MKNSLLNSVMLIGSIGAGLLATDAQAQVFDPARGNLLWASRDVNGGNRGANDIIVDLGNAQRFTSGTAPLLLGGTSASEAYGGVPAVSENRFAHSDVIATFGDLDNVLNSAWGVNSAVAPTANTSWFLTRARVDNDVQSTAWTRQSTISQGGTGNKMETVRQGAASAGTDFNSTSTREDSAFSAAYGNPSNSPFTGYASMERSTGTGFTGGAISRLDLYDVRATPPAGLGDYLGYFEYQADGDLWFIPENFTPVPEPSTYGVVAGIGLLGMAIRRKLTAKNA